MDLSPAIDKIRYNFDFQVWRPSPTVDETGCYSLVNNFITISASLPTNPETNHVARVTPPPQNQLQFQPGDVLGFYIESHEEGGGLDDNNGVVLLNAGSELVWFSRIDTPPQTFQSGSCPYPVGTNGVLSRSTYAAPVISISVTTYSCPGSVSLLIPSVSANTLSAIISPQQTPTISAPTTPSTDSIVTGVVVIIIIVCIAIMIVVTTLAIILIVKRHNAVKKTLNSTTRPTNSLTLANIVYGKL